ncbi:MAG TPA: methyltransferase domain-containing protein [Persephonella sp.]|nr:methyltransferase domain-containing protein [Hydrogenothermaceae bacterium]HIQ25562.1 methyltransferase domain-containing protein [Persephonella sp.]
MANTKIASKVFSSVSKVYDKFLEKFTLGYIHKWQSKLIENTTVKETVLDIGTGTGEILKKINESYPNIYLIGVDISFSMLKLAKKKLPKANFILADAHNLPLKNQTITNIFFSLTFRHLNYKDILRSLKKILKKEGEISILEIPKPSKFIYFLIIIFMKFIFKPIGILIFTKEEYEYFIHSIENSLTVKELVNLFEKNGFKTVYIEKKLFGLLVLAVFRKES